MVEMKLLGCGSCCGGAGASARTRGMGDPAAQSTVTASPQLWQPAECRGRRCGSPNIFQGMDLRQLRRLFRLSGDNKASRRAQLVWGHGEGAELAGALIALRAQGRKGHTRVPKWLTAFNHLRIGEVSARTPTEDCKGHLETKPLGDEGPNVTSAEPLEGEQGVSATDQQPGAGQPKGPSVCLTRNRPGVSRGSEEDRDPERYLHHVLR
ncbi:arginine vasopressin-induced protein 1-like [Arapaima gigas]